MAPKVERVQRNEDYQFRQPGCSCCGKRIPSVSCSNNSENYNNNSNTKWYNSRYIGPAVFALAVLGAAFLSECTGNRNSSIKQGIEHKTSSP